MNFCPASFLARWLGLAAFIMAAWPGSAQQTIQFTKPVDQDQASTANAFMPASTRRNSAGAFNAPAPLFGSRSPEANFDVLPGSSSMNAANANANAMQWQKVLEGKKNWMLMTPEEIFGTTTPEKIMGITDPKENPKLSLVERFLLRQDQLAGGGTTNGYHRADAAYWRGNSATDPFH